jgi:uncharacterized RDD family membrane protein YckC
MQPTDFWEDLEVIEIETPEMLPLRLPLAGFGPRALAWFIDSLILGVGLFIVFMFIIVALAGSSAFSASDGGRAVKFFVILIASLAMLSPVLYFAAFEFFWNGQTPGKRWLGIRVIRRGGLPLGFGQVLLRNLLRIVDYLPSNGMAGLVSFFASQYQQRIGDLAADTVVVREFRSRQPFDWAGTPSALSVRPPAAGMLTPALAYITGSYLSRMGQLPQPVRLELTSELIRRLGYSAATLSLREREDYLASLLYAPPGGG